MNTIYIWYIHNENSLRNFCLPEYYDFVIILNILQQMPLDNICTTILQKNVA